MKKNLLLLFLLTLLLPATAVAYDFEVDGIYYNKTSVSTVEVTYKDTNYNSYNGSVTIPSTITVNVAQNYQATYTVTSIGDYAFYHSDDVSDLTIPETVISIGECAFYGCHPHTMTCLAMEPPTLNNSFDEARETRYDYWCTSDPMYTLYIRPEASNNYYIEPDLFLSEICTYFNFTLKTNGEITSSSLITFYEDERYGWNGDFLHADIYVFADGAALFIYEYDNWVNCGQYEAYADFETGGTSISAVAVKYGCLPSSIVHYSYSPPSSPAYVDTTYSSTYSFIVDGIAYRQLGNNSVAVAPDVDLTFYHPFDPNDDHGPDEKSHNNDADYFCHGLYNGHIEIPSTIEYEGKTYNVTSIDPYTFGNFGFFYEYEPEAKGYISSNSKYIDYYVPFFKGDIEGRNLTSIVLPSSITSINGAFYDCTNLERITLPNSVTNMEYDWLDWVTDIDATFTGCNNIKYFHLTGDGEWSGDSLNVSVPRLDIANGITAIPGLQVNPREVYSYASVPPTCDENTFTDYTGTLHVPASSLAAYFTAPYWCNFANIVGDAVELNSISLNRDSAELLVGEQLTLDASIQPINASIDSLVWSSSNEDIATVIDGVVTAKAQGECDVTVSVLDKRATCHVTVTEIAPTSITLSQNNATMELDSTLLLTAVIAPDNATYQTINWSSSNTSIATVNDQGVVTARGIGECDIIASCKGLTDTCHIKVIERFIYITLDEHYVSLLPNHIVTITPTVSPVATDLVVTSSNPAVAAARVMGGKVQVVGVSVGRAIIKVASADGNAFADSCIVNVYIERGDVNGDGYVNIGDVTALIDCLLTGSTSPGSDVDGNGQVSINDVSGLIDFLLNGSWMSEDQSSEIFSVNGVSFKMVRVPAGTFQMGATEEQGSDVYNWERPVHEVTLTSSYLIGETEVTQELWLAVMGSNPSKHLGSLQKPVENVSWLDCQEFISTLNGLTGRSFRLPTEAEWEYAARGGNRSRGYMYAGSDSIDEVGNVSSSTTLPVGMLQPNELFLYDMSGNVDEWVWDYYSNYTSEPQTDPTGPESGTYHVYRGGSWYGGANAARVSYRYYRASTFKRGTMGLRLAL